MGQHKTTTSKDYYIACQRIEENYENCCQSLDLGDLTLEELPDSIRKLKHLQVLTFGKSSRQTKNGESARRSNGRLFNQQFTDISALSALSNLTFLDLSCCIKLSDLTPLGGLSSLAMLDLESCHAVSDLTPLGALTGLISLNLAFCDAVFDLTPLSKLTSISRLSLEGCRKVSDLTPLCKLTDVTCLNLSFCSGVSELTPLKYLNALTELQIHDCSRISDLSPISGLTSLSTFIMVDCPGVCDLTPLGQLTSLSTLILPFCECLSDLSPFGRLTGLVSLDLNRCNNICDLTPLRGLTKLNSLDVAGSTGICDLTPLSGLNRITSLSLGGCTGIKDLTPFSRLTSLSSLNLSCCEGIIDLTPLSRLTSLTLLDLSGCIGITDLRPLASLAGLDSLCLDGCSSLRYFAPLLCLLPRLRTLELHRCNFLDLDPLVCGKAPEENVLGAVQAHYAELELGASDAIESRVFILGNGGVGKTQLCNRLCGMPFDPNVESTHGVRLNHIDIEISGYNSPVRVNLWDFGGQDIYLGSHALFVQSPAVFLVLWTAATEDGEYIDENGGLTFQNRPLWYWLDYIRSVVGTGNPILVVQSKSDIVPDERQIPATISADFESLHYLHFSARDDAQLMNLRATLVHTVGDLLAKYPPPLVGVGRVRLIRHLRQMLEQDRQRPERQRRRTMSREAFQRLCDKVGQVREPLEMLKYLARSSVVFWRSDAFQGRIILDQSWAIDVIYALFHRVKSLPTLFANGRFTREGLAALVWQNVPKSDQQVFLDMMESCGICFRCRRLNDHWEHFPEWEYVAPELLPTRDSREVQRDLAGRLPEVSGLARADVCYRFLHVGILRRFLCWLGRHVSDNAIFWKLGCWFYEPMIRGGVLIDSRWEANEEHPWQGTVAFEAWGDHAARTVNWLVGQLTTMGFTETPNISFINTTSDGTTKLLSPKLGTRERTAWYDFIVTAPSLKGEQFPDWLTRLEFDTTDTLLALAELWQSWPTEEFNSRKFADELKTQGFELSNRRVLGLMRELERLSGPLIEETRRGAVSQRFLEGGRARLRKAAITLRTALAWHSRRT